MAKRDEEKGLEEFMREWNKSTEDSHTKIQRLIAYGMRNWPKPKELPPDTPDLPPAEGGEQG